MSGIYDVYYCDAVNPKEEFKKCLPVKGQETSSVTCLAS